jgi:hypothetical protein
MRALACCLIIDGRDSQYANGVHKTLVQVATALVPTNPRFRLATSTIVEVRNPSTERRACKRSNDTKDYTDSVHAFHRLTRAEGAAVNREGVTKRSVARGAALERRKSSPGPSERQLDK